MWQHDISTQDNSMNEKCLLKIFENFTLILPHACLLRGLKDAVMEHITVREVWRNRWHVFFYLRYLNKRRNNLPSIKLLTSVGFFFFNIHIQSTCILTVIGTTDKSLSSATELSVRNFALARYNDTCHASSNYCSWQVNQGVMSPSTWSKEKSHHQENTCSIKRV